MQNQEHNINEDPVQDGNQDKESDIKAENRTSTDAKGTDDKSAELEAKTKELNDKYLRLYSEYDNYRKRTVKERSDIIKTAGEDVFKAILPVLDDFDRAIKANEQVTDVEVVKQGYQLIFNKLKNITQQKGLTAFDSKGETFNPDTMEAITQIPASNEAEKGKVIEEVERGYKLGEKVIRFAKVVIAQ
jgi:molecular chaperone GrpE